MFTRRTALMGGIGLAGVLASGGMAQAADDVLAANKKLAERYITEVINDGNFDALDELVAEDYMTDDPDLAAGRDALRERLEYNYQGANAIIDELTRTIEQMTAEADRVVVRGNITGTMNGENLKALYFMEAAIGDGRIAQIWNVEESIFGF